MQIQLKHKLFSWIFLMIFFAKMVISVAPLVADHFDSKIANAVIMQVELENNCESGKSAKENLKTLYHYLSKPDTLLNPVKVLALNRYYIEDDNFNHLHYPTVPTPPPNC